jgi:hypothetical protein
LKNYVAEEEQKDNLTASSKNNNDISNSFGPTSTSRKEKKSSLQEYKKSKPYVSTRNDLLKRMRKNKTLMPILSSL